MPPSCINSVDGSLNGDRVLRAQFGTTKYCSAYLRGETCTNKNCSFLHETGEDGQHTSLQNEPHGARIVPRPPMATQATQMIPPIRPLSATQSATSQGMARQGSAENEISRKSSEDGSALPSTASWANMNATVTRTRRASQSHTGATPSPQMTHASLAVKKPEEFKSKETSTTAPSTSTATVKATFMQEQPPPKPKPKPVDPGEEMMDHFRRVLSRDLKFSFDASILTPEERAVVDSMPSFIDPYGGAKRRRMRDREEAEQARLEAEVKAKLEAQATSAAEETLEEDNIVAGSLALGGEPEDDPRSASTRGAIGRPMQSFNDQFSSMGLSARNLGAQRQQTTLPSTATLLQAPGLGQPSAQNISFDMFDTERRGPQYSQSQYEQISNHQRHGSRYFNNDNKTGTASSRFQGQQQGFYSSGVQGPPPGLPTAGTPPVSGGGMFAHGQNFTNPGFSSSKDINAEGYSRNRSGTNQGHDMAKRELILSLQNDLLRSPPLQAPAPGVVNPLYAQYQTYQDPGLVKQRKKGKKHRHANTSSSGGGVEHLADPTIASARVHQSNTTGQGLFGGNQGGYQQANLYGGGGYNRW